MGRSGTGKRPEVLYLAFGWEWTGLSAVRGGEVRDGMGWKIKMSMAIVTVFPHWKD